MKIMLIIGALGLALSLQACNQAEEPATEASAESGASAAGDPSASNPPASSQPAATAPGADAGAFRTTGKITTVAGSKVTIAHQAVEGLGWPAMTMTFEAPDAAMLQGVQPGADVEFAFRKSGEQYVLTEIQRR